MPEYLVLLAPSSNRVYAGDAPAITAAEAEIVVSAVHLGGVVGASPTTVAGVPYLAVELADAVDPRILGGLAATFAVFEREGDLLRPVEARGGERFDDDLLTIPKYPGKTNEQLTRVLLNVTLASTDLPDRARRTVLDPLAGRGTTLSWALTLGHDAVGVEVERREVEAYSAFLTTWLRRKRLKHRIGLTPLRRDGRRLGDLLEAEIGRDDPQSLVLFAADTLATAELLQRRRVDVVVTDAPYGVAHGSRGVRGGRDRSPADLLADALPVWVSVLRPGGAVGIAWNTHGLSRADLVARCGRAGLEVCDDGPYRGFAHRVDAGIHRDLLVARKPR
ncbi:MAG TPA: SAM-dependent methyltransferase [Lapillicoccus sp.]|uniref:TRM11 family SAM-dependent methyltransferase n=1 Tax=Lapillicoccus sp. TaxID=1909287 RepID=UPI002F943138